MNQISEERKRIGVTQADLANKLHWSQSRIGNYESGTRTPDLHTSRKIVHALNELGGNCSLDSVFPPESKAA
ncbi:TPA: helix-turn-helix transcriptional regulator [Yersinia enterocolitica]